MTIIMQMLCGKLMARGEARMDSTPATSIVAFPLLLRALLRTGQGPYLRCFADQARTMMQGTFE